MSNPFFDHPIVNSPYECPSRHWELDDDGQPTQKITEHRRSARFVAPVPKPKKPKQAAAQEAFVFDEGKGLSTKDQQYDATSNINEGRRNVDAWRASGRWKKSAKLLKCGECGSIECRVASRDWE